MDLHFSLTYEWVFSFFMYRMPSTGIHLFHRDLRVHDNVSLYQCAQRCDNVLGVFVVDPVQTSDDEHEYYRSYNALRFILESVIDLDKQMKGNLWVCTMNELLKYVSENDISLVSFNRDYTKYAVKRDSELTKKMAELGVECISSVDHLLTTDAITKKDGYPYIVFSFFYKEAKKVRPTRPRLEQVSWTKVGRRYKSFDVKHLLRWVSARACELPSTHGGRKKGLSMLTKAKKKKLDSSVLTSYGGTLLAPYLNFGCLSAREVYTELVRKTSITRNLYWRDFYATIPMTSVSAREYRWLDPRYNRLKWRTAHEFKSEWLKMWESKTGFHLVDASTKQLRKTGYLPNRARMIWTWFCIRCLQVNPFDKKYGAMSIFSRELIDANTSQNKFNFEWMMSSLDLAGRRFARGAPLAGRWMDVSNKAISKYHAKEWIEEWLTTEERNAEPIFDIEERYNEWVDRVRLIS